MMSMDQLWLSDSRLFSLTDNDVHVWYAQLTASPDQVIEFAKILSKNELARADRFHSTRDRSAFITSRAILRTLVSQYLGLSPYDVAFFYNQHGKPALDVIINPVGLEFNLSHSHDLVIFAFSQKRILGVDLEYQHSLPDLKEIAAKCLSRAEFEKWDRLPLAQQQETFFLYWTQKEAFLKAKGYGLLQPINSIELISEPEIGVVSEYVEHNSEGVNRWSYISTVPAPGYVASLFISGYQCQLTCREYS